MTGRSGRGVSPWLTVVLVALGAAVAQAFGRFTYGVVLPAVAADLSLSNTVAGLLGTINVGAYLFGTVVVAAAASKVRLITVLRVGFLFSVAGLIGLWLTPNAYVMGVAMFSAGLGGALIWIPSPVIAADAMPSHRRPLAVAFMGSGIGTGIVFSSQLSAVVRGRFGDDSWRLIYGIEAAVGVVTLVLILSLVRHGQSRPRSQRAGIGGFSVLRTMNGWLPLTLAYTAYGFSYLLVIAFLTKRLEEDSGWTADRAATAFTVLGVCVIGGGPLFISLARRYGARPIMAIAFGLWAVCTLAVLPGWFGVSLAASGVLGLLFAAVPGIITLYVVENTSVDDYGPSFAAATLAFGVAQMLAPQVGGALADVTGSFTIVFILSALFALAGMTASLRLPAKSAAS